MRDRLLIYAGLGLFVLLVAYPVWYGLFAGTTAAGPDITTARGKGDCVAPKNEMRAAHMTLLMGWRDTKVRNGERTFRNRDGAEYAISLTGTCLTRCHGGNREKFCDRCHSFAGVPTPDCWQCHVSPVTPVASMTGGQQ